MNTREQKLLADIKKIVGPAMHRELVLLRARNRKLEQQRDEWKERAMRYRKQYLDQKNGVIPDGI